MVLVVILDEQTEHYTLSAFSNDNQTLLGIGKAEKLAINNIIIIICLSKVLTMPWAPNHRDCSFSWCYLEP